MQEEIAELRNVFNFFERRGFVVTWLRGEWPLIYIAIKSEGVADPVAGYVDDCANIARVIAHLRENGFTVLECRSGEAVARSFRGTIYLEIEPPKKPAIPDAEAAG